MSRFAASGRRLLLGWELAMALMLAVAAATPAFGQPRDKSTESKYVTRSEDDLLLLSLRIESVTLTQELEAYQVPGSVLIPMGEVFRLLEIAITASPSSGSADGFYTRTDRPFHVDLRAKTASLAGKPLQFARDQIEVHVHDIYIDVRQMNDWFALGMVVNTHDSSIRVSPKEPLPLQRRLQRERHAGALRGLLSAYEDPGFPREPNSYSSLGDIAIDQATTVRMISSSGGSGADLKYTALITDDVAHMGLNAFLDFESAKAPNMSQISLNRMDEYAGLLGSMHAREITAGQIYSTAIPLVSDSHLSDGLVISNYPLYRATSFDTTDLSGTLPSGWDVELYRGTILFAYQASDSTGRYEFKKVPLQIGNNVYRLVFYGPQGQRREESRIFNIGDSLVPRGENWYRLTVEPGPQSNSQYAMQDEYGIRRNLTGRLGIATAQLSDGMHQYISTGFQGFSGGMLSYLNLVYDPRSGSADELGFQWQWKRTAIELKETMVDGFQSQVMSPSVNPVQDQTLFRLGNVSTPKWSHLDPTDVDITYEKSRLGVTSWAITDRLSYQRPGLGVTNLLSYATQTDALVQGKGELLINKIGHTQMLQGQISYDWAPTPKFEQFSVQTQRFLPGFRLLSLGAYYTGAQQNFGVTVALTKNSGRAAYSLTADISCHRGLVLGMSTSMSSLKTPNSAKWITQAQAQAARGAILLRVYLDRNGNGKHDKGELPVEGVGFAMNEMGVSGVTDKSGELLIEGLTAFRPVDVHVDQGSLSDPIWTPGSRGIRVIPRPGHVPVIELPIVCTGEITGTAYDRSTIGAVPAASVQLELVDTSGKTVQKQTTAYDGFYNFSKVAVGKYQIRVAQAQLDEMGRTAREMTLTVPPDGAYLDGINITLEGR